MDLKTTKQMCSIYNLNNMQNLLSDRSFVLVCDLTRQKGTPEWAKLPLSPAVGMTGSVPLTQIICPFRSSLALFFTYKLQSLTKVCIFLVGSADSSKLMVRTLPYEHVLASGLQDLWYGS